MNFSKPARALLQAIALGATIVVTSAASAFSITPAPGRERLSLDRGWLFHLGDIVPPPIVGHEASYGNAKAGNAGGAAATRYNDAGWRKLDLPHDWAVEGPFDPAANVAQGYRPRGIGWYRRYLRVDESERGRHFELQLDAVASQSTVWVNGNVVQRTWSGYSGANIDITPYLRYGDAANTIAVRADASVMEGWWYEGAGMYRHAWLVKTNPVHIETDGIHATPVLSGGKWSIPVEVTLANSGKRAENVTVEVTLTGPDGKRAGVRSVALAVPLLGRATVTLPMAISAPALWTLEQRRLYTVAAVVRQGGREVDASALQTGLRSIRFDAQQGFFLNGQHLKLQGVCIHQDHAGVGVALPDSIWEYRLRRLKELGVNAIRLSHNAPAAEVLDMADRMGFLVMDENRNFNPSPDYMAQLEWMVRRDRHHPSVILWSVFNEEPVQGTEIGYEMARRMAAAVRALDTTRPVTAAMNGGFFTPLNVSHAVDVLGANYQVRDYDRVHKERPDLPFTSSEDTSAFMTRGEFATDASHNLIASYDDDFASWGNSHRDAWQAIDSRPFVAGGFVWTGFDYRGEPTPNSWPSVSSVFGIMDLNGFPKAAYYIHQAQWIRDRPLVHIEPHWNWAGREGQAIRVMVTANTERVKLLLNGRELGEQRVDPYRMNDFMVAYQPGRLEAVGYSGGKEVVRTSVETTGAPVRLELVPDRATLAGDGRDAMPITVRALDAAGRAVPLADAQLTFAVTGAGASIGHGNGDPNSHEDEKGATRRLFNGLAQLIVQSRADGAGGAGTVSVMASAPGLQAASVAIPVLTVALPPFVPQQEAPAIYLQSWRMSPASALRPDPNRKLADNDMNSWEPVQAPAPPQDGGAGGYRVYRTQFSAPTPAPGAVEAKARIRFEHVSGRAELWIDGVLAGKKDSFDGRGWQVALPPALGQGQHQINVLLEAQPRKPAGIDGNVLVERQ